MSRNWIKAEERMPTAEDADAWGCVEVYHKYQGPMITGWRQVKDNCFMTHWKKTTPPPPEYKEKL